LAKLLYEATKGTEWEHLVWEEEQEKAFREIKRALTNAPALGLPDVMKPFFLYVQEPKGTAVGVPDSATNLLAPSGGLLVKTTPCCFPRLAALPVCLSSHCHLSGRSRQAYSRARTPWLGSPLLLTLMEYKGNYWLTNSWMVKYQSMLCENPHIQLEVVNT
jgi:hypothetical protein